MNWLMIAMRALPTIIGLMGIAEKALADKPKSGEEKKAIVKEGAKAIIGGVADASTGGQKETWEKIDSMIDPFIDLAARFIFWKT